MGGGVGCGGGQGGGGLGDGICGLAKVMMVQVVLGAV